MYSSSRMRDDYWSLQIKLQFVSLSLAVFNSSLIWSMALQGGGCSGRQKDIFHSFAEEERVLTTRLRTQLALKQHITHSVTNLWWYSAITLVTLVWSYMVEILLLSLGSLWDAMYCTTCMMPARFSVFFWSFKRLMTVACLQTPCCDCSSMTISYIWKPNRTTLCIFMSYQAESLKVRRSTWRSWGSHESSRASTSAKLPMKLPQQMSSKSGSLWTVSTSQLGQGNRESFAHRWGLLQDKQRSVSGLGLYNLKWGHWENCLQSDTCHRVQFVL